jgi:hypothetical protein
VTTITKAKAEALFKQLDGSLATLSDAITQIATTKAWTVLGYTNLGEAVNDRLSILTGTARSAIIAALVAADVPSVDILEIRGVSPVAVLAAMQLAGKAPKSEATGFTKSSDATRVQVTLSKAKRDQYAAAARERGMSLGDFILAALEHESSASA